MRLLELPRTATVKGPGQVQNDIESSNIGSPRFTQTLSQFLTLNRTQEGSQITLGNQLTLPVGGGLLYVEPIYVSAKTGSSYPLSRAVVVAFGNQLAWSDTLGGALDGLFGGSSGAVAGDTGSGGGTTTPPPAAGSGTPAQQSAALKAALADIQKAFGDGQDALKKGDWAAYGEAQKRLQAAVQEAVAAAADRVGDHPGPDPSVAVRLGDTGSGSGAQSQPEQVGTGGLPRAGRREPAGLPAGPPLLVTRRGGGAARPAGLGGAAPGRDRRDGRSQRGRGRPGRAGGRDAAAGAMLGAAVAIREARRAREREEKEGLRPHARAAEPSPWPCAVPIWPQREVHVVLGSPTRGGAAR